MVRKPSRRQADRPPRTRAQELFSILTSRLSAIMLEHNILKGSNFSVLKGTTTADTIHIVSCRNLPSFVTGMTLRSIRPQTSTIEEQFLGVEFRIEVVIEIIVIRIDIVELAMALEEKFDIEIPDEEMEKLTTVQA
ncbi:hypothetical protein BGX30_011705, partial [Mortierella sp. GBA39]